LGAVGDGPSFSTSLTTTASARSRAHQRAFDTVDRGCEEPVPKEAQLKGFEVEDGRYWQNFPAPRITAGLVDVKGLARS
jgi:hypothetical protein